MTQPTAQPPPPEIMLMQMLMGKWVSMAITTAAELGLADHLRDGARGANDVAKQAGANADATYRLLRALAAVGVFKELPGRRFENNALSEKLRSDIPGSARAMARWIGEKSVWQAWGYLDHSVRTGEPAYPKVFGMGAWEYLKTHSETAAIFNDAMTGFSEMTAQAVCEAYDFTPFKKIVDIGGGQGRLLATVLAKAPKATGVLFDMPSVVAGAKNVIGRDASFDRITTAGGDFFESVPEGGDLYMMKAIIHDWDDERSIKILSNCRKRMAPNGRVLILDQVLSDGPESTMGKLLDLEMLLVTEGGRERTAAEFETLYKKSGFALSRIIPTKSPTAIIEGTPA
jgi:hypothetical protein